MMGRVMGAGYDGNMNDEEQDMMKAQVMGSRV